MKKQLYKWAVQISSYCLMILVTSCFGEVDEPFVPKFDIKEIEGFSPIYAGSENEEIAIVDAQSIVNAGKIVTYSDHIIIEEAGKGFHLIDNSNSSNPKNIGFLSVPNSRNIAIKQNVIYVDSYADLIAIEVALDMSVSVSRLEDVFEDTRSINLPPESGYYFDCVEDDKGDVVGWRRDIVYNPQCYY
ncbi:MAG: hypothetical protein OCD76_01105 [Reichenbachiella sp.]